MAILKRAMFGGGIKGVSMADGSNFSRSWGGIESVGMFGHYTSQTYASAYPSIRAISAEYMQVLPYAIDGNGKPTEHDVITALYHPNREDSVVSFSEKVAVSTLVRPKTYLLVWRKDGKVARPGGDFRKKSNKIAGFTFLERPVVERKNGNTFYKVGTDTYTENEVLVLPGGVDPQNLYSGYSPSEAARRWVKLDDYIADYQAGFFENGAIPAGMFTVTAATDTDYNDAVDALEAKHRGAGKNNNVTYSHRPVGQEGQNNPAGIEWTPLQQANKDIDFKNLFEQTNRRIDTAFGVPGVVKGVDGEAKYDNAEVAEATFAKRAVYPLLLRNYTQLTHELNRITGGLGIAIAFDYEIPSVADSEKVKAETKQVEAGLITSLTTAGYSLDSIVNAFDLSNRYKLLKKGTEPAVIDNPKPEVDEGNEVTDAPNPEIIGGDYYVRSTAEAAKSTNPKASSRTKITQEEIDAELGLEDASRKYLNTQVERVINDLDGDGVEDILLSDSPEPTEEELDTFVDEAFVVILSILIFQGLLGKQEAIDIANDNDIPTTGIGDFVLSDLVQERYKTYLRRVGVSYGSDTAASIRAVLAQADIDGLGRDQIIRNLRQIPGLDEYRVKRLAVTELNRSSGMAKIEGFKQLADETGTQWEKGLVHANTPKDQYCLATVGVYVPLDDSYFPVGGTIIGTDGGILVNNWVNNECVGIHPNCEGRPDIRLVG